METQIENIKNIENIENIENINISNYSEQSQISEIQKDNIQLSDILEKYDNQILNLVKKYTDDVQKTNEEFTKQVYKCINNKNDELKRNLLLLSSGNQNSELFKICNKCKNKKNISEYYKDLKTKDGFKNICKSCYISPPKH